MKNYRRKDVKPHLLSKLILQLVITFIIATFSIVLYDMYINIDVEDSNYTAEKVSKEISTKNTEDVSTMLETVSKSVVRNI